MGLFFFLSSQFISTSIKYAFEIIYEFWVSLSPLRSIVNSMSKSHRKMDKNNNLEAKKSQIQIIQKKFHFIPFFLLSRMKCVALNYCRCVFVLSFLANKFSPRKTTENKNNSPFLCTRKTAFSPRHITFLSLFHLLNTSQSQQFVDISPRLWHT